MKKDLVIIGGGPAGLAAAIAAREAGIEELLVVERDDRPGGILNQCIHNGFGLHTFREELTGPEYAARFADRARELGIPCRLGAMAVELRMAGAEEEQAGDEEKEQEAGEEVAQAVCAGDGQTHNGCPGENAVSAGQARYDKIVTLMSREDGLYTVEARAVILAMGCRERPRGALNIPGFRPAGIYSAGTAQRYVNVEGRMPGREVVILGSGDIGLIMARRMTLEGARVKLVAELMPYSGGLKRNIVQCLEDFDIPLRLGHTVVDIRGKERVEAVVIARVDEHGKPVPGTEEEIACDTLLLSCGLIPENELSAGLGLKLNPATNGPLVDESLETEKEGVFACGNVLHVHDLVDYVSEEAAQAGKRAAAYLRGELKPAGRAIPIRAAEGVRYTVPVRVEPGRMEEAQTVRFRVDNVYRDAAVTVEAGGRTLLSRRKRVLAPGEMEQVTLKRAELERLSGAEEIVIRVRPSS